MKGPNPSVGTVPCPIDGKHTCTVHKFQPRHATDAGRRKAGKFYLKCPGHGRLGFDGDPWIQEHVLEHIAWAEGIDIPTTAQGAAASTATPASSIPITTTRGSSGTARPAAASPSRPTSSPSSSRSRPPSAPSPAPRSTSSGKQTGTQTQTPPAKKAAWWEDLL